MKKLQKLGLAAQKLGLAALLAITGACADDIKGVNLAKRNPKVGVEASCTIDHRMSLHDQMGRNRGTLSFTHAVDTNGDGIFDESFVTEGYFMGNSGTTTYQQDNEIVHATTHYVAPGITEDEQLLTGFPRTTQMSPEYQSALRLACNGLQGQ